MMVNFLRFIMVMVILNLRCSVNGESIKDVGNVLEDVFNSKDYHKEIRGKLDQTQHIDVNVGFSLQYIKHIDEIEETFEAFGVLFLLWTDERLIWDPKNYNGTNKVFSFVDFYYSSFNLIAYFM